MAESFRVLGHVIDHGAARAFDDDGDSGED
jgi:hypothetical protein